MNKAMYTPHRSEAFRVQMADTDAAALLYLAAPLRWAEGMFTRWLAEAGHPLSELLAEGLGFPVVTSSVDYHAPVRMDDVLQSSLRVTTIGRRSADLHYTFVVTGDNDPAVEVRIRHVYSGVGSGAHVDRLPDWFIDLFNARHLGEDDGLPATPE